MTYVANIELLYTRCKLSERSRPPYGTEKVLTVPYDMINSHKYQIGALGNQLEYSVSMIYVTQWNFEGLYQYQNNDIKDAIVCG